MAPSSQSKAVRDNVEESIAASEDVDEQLQEQDRQGRPEEQGEVEEFQSEALGIFHYVGSMPVSSAACLERLGLTASFAFCSVACISGCWPCIGCGFSWLDFT